MLAPDAEKFNDLKRRQKIADQARPKPKASDLRFDEMLDPAAANASGADRDAARQRWIDQMQAKADPKQIRRAAREREEEQREREKQEESAARQEFEKQWWEREALRQARSAEVNAQARQHWANIELPVSQQTVVEPVMPPETVDFAAVRRRMSAERAQHGAAIISGGAIANYARASSSGSASRAASAPRAGSASRAGSARSNLIAAQDAEFQLSLLHDELQTLRAEQGALNERRQQLQTQLDEAEQQQKRASDRLARYGDNPKLQSESDEAGQLAECLRTSLTDICSKISIADAEIEDKQHMLACLRDDGHP